MTRGRVFATVGLVALAGIGGATATADAAGTYCSTRNERKVERRYDNARRAEEKAGRLYGEGKINFELYEWKEKQAIAAWAAFQTWLQTCE